MYHFNKKQKIILGVLTAIVAGVICYYVYAGESNNYTQFDQENTLEIENEQTKEEMYSDDTIFVHVSGAVNQEGIIELKVNSRISDAIEKARWSKTRCFYRGH